MIKEKKHRIIVNNKFRDFDQLNFFTVRNRISFKHSLVVNFFFVFRVSFDFSLGKKMHRNK